MIKFYIPNYHFTVFVRTTFSGLFYDDMVDRVIFNFNPCENRQPCVQLATPEEVIQFKQFYDL